jgi:Cu2+-exporting ATPase
MIQHWVNPHVSFFGSKYILLALLPVVFFYGGWPFLKGLADGAKARNPGMLFLIGFAITIAYIWSVSIVFGLRVWISFGNRQYLF